jgi:hypothetical protein
MHIPMALAKLNDERAIPLLIKIIKKPSTQVEDNDSDSSDDFSVSGTPRLVLESYSALESLISMYIFNHFVLHIFLFSR